jgi:hypothetical protein
VWRECAVSPTTCLIAVVLPHEFTSAPVPMSAWELWLSALRLSAPVLEVDEGPSVFWVRRQELADSPLVAVGFFGSISERFPLPWPRLL